MSVFVNRTLNMKKIKVIGFDMDYTIVRYHSDEFERLAYHTVIGKLVHKKGYPTLLFNNKFHPELVIQGLVIDKKRGNLLKLSRFGKVKTCYHGTKLMDFRLQQEIYGGLAIDPSESEMMSLDTSFSMATGVLFMELIDLKDQGLISHDYSTITDHLKYATDEAHMDGSLKNEVRKNLAKYIVQDPEIVNALERLKKYQKRLVIITNSDYSYTQLLLDYAITPFLKDHKCWSELFEIVITLSKKPRFFLSRNDFLVVDRNTGHMTNLVGPVVSGIYQGGDAAKLQQDLHVEGDEILYIGDHIYGDVLSLKKKLNWRTALVTEPLIAELASLKQTKSAQDKIDALMEQKEQIEVSLNHLYVERVENNGTFDKDKAEKFHKEIEAIDGEITLLLETVRAAFNPYWGELMRAGQEESLFAGQIEKYACIYMTKISDMLAFSPRTYFRPKRRNLAHDF